jgi:HEPN domain-containing protein
MGQRLWQQAERDMEFAQVLMQPRGYYLAANLAHQAAEKSLKAACWHLRGEEPPWRHGLEHTAQLLVQNPQDIPATVAAAIALLNPIFEQTRYPSGDISEPIPSDLIGEVVAQDAIKAAEDVMTWARRLLQQPPGRSQPGTRS